MRLAILGTRGVPARYGGFETLAEELSARLAARGHDVTVYPRTRYAQRGLAIYRGARIRVLPTIPTKYLDTVVHGALSGFDAALARYEAVLFCNAINAAFAFLPRLMGRTRVVLNVDGLERNRRKWNPLGRLAYRVSETLSTMIPDVIVSDARVIQDYYRARYGFPTIFIPYGGDLPQPQGTATIERLGLKPEKYVLYVSRLEPENNADAVVRAYRDVPGEAPLVVVGYRELLARAAVYVQATEVGGTHPALVEALGYGRVVCYNATPENEEVAGGAGLPFDARRPETLSTLLAGILDDPPAYSVWKDRAKARVADRYRWEDVAARYEAVLEGRPLIQ